MISQDNKVTYNSGLENKLRELILIPLHNDIIYKGEMATDE